MNERFDILSTSIDGLRLLLRHPRGDERGAFERLFCDRELEALTERKPIAQINRSFTSTRGAVRGMHFQYPPHSEIKFVSCLRGEVFDVAIDLRSDSATFLHWHAEVLTENNHKTLVIPEGFAHGFQSLTADCEILYFHTAPHAPHAEGGLDARDPRLAIEWPLTITEISARDQAHPRLSHDFKGLSS